MGLQAKDKSSAGYSGMNFAAGGCRTDSEIAGHAVTRSSPSLPRYSLTMDLALATADYLRPIADALVYINTTKVHPVWFPYPIAPTLHAARISIVYQSNARRSPSALSWGTYITGYLIMVCTLRLFVDCVGWNLTF